MKLGEFLKSLSFGELSSLSIGSEGKGFIKEDEVNKLVSVINESLLVFSTKFILSEKQLIVQTLDWKTNYYLRKEYAVTDPTPVPYKYIMDTVDYPFKGDLVKILEVTNEMGRTLPLNDAEQWLSVFTPEFDLLQINHPSDEAAFCVVYQALHDTLREKIEDEDDEEFYEQDIRIPPPLREAFKCLVGYKIFSPMGGQDFSGKAQEFLFQYEKLCGDIEAKNLIGDTSINTNIKLHKRGFP